MMVKRQLLLEPRLHLHLKILGLLHIGAMVSLFFTDQLLNKFSQNYLDILKALRREKAVQCTFIIKSTISLGAREL